MCMYTSRYVWPGPRGVCYASFPSPFENRNAQDQATTVHTRGYFVSVQVGSPPISSAGSPPTRQLKPVLKVRRNARRRAFHLFREKMYCENAYRLFDRVSPAIYCSPWSYIKFHDGKTRAERREKLGIRIFRNVTPWKSERTQPSHDI